MKKQLLFSIVLLIGQFIMAQEHMVEILNSQDGNGYVISAKNNGDTQQEVTLTVTVKNMKGYTEPVTKLVKAKETLAMVRLEPMPGKKASFNASYQYKPKPTEAEIANQDEKLKEKVVTRVEDMNEGIVLFYKDGCPRCHYVTTYMLNNNIDFKLLDTSSDKESNKMMWKLLKEVNPDLNNIKMPVVLVEGKVNYNMEDLKGFAKGLLRFK